MTEQGGAMPFRLEEATIERLHAAIRAGETTVVAVVQAYIERAKAYNGVASLLVTENGQTAVFVPPLSCFVRCTVSFRTSAVMCRSRCAAESPGVCTSETSRSVARMSSAYAHNR